MSIGLVFLTKLLDPVAAVIAVVVAGLTRSLWGIPVAALAAVTVHELVVAATVPGWSFGFMVFAIGFAAMLVWAAAGHMMRRVLAAGE